MKGTDKMGQRERERGLFSSTSRAEEQTRIQGYKDIYSPMTKKMCTGIHLGDVPINKKKIKKTNSTHQLQA